MTNEEIQIRLIRQELEKMLTFYEVTEEDDQDIIETLVERLVDLQSYLANNTKLPPVYAYPWQRDDGL
tara:strand:+ start:8266 stop:8469 length:204 start_codon:yes stop_codon:yes gene_type:complete